MIYLTFLIVLWQKGVAKWMRLLQWTRKVSSLWTSRILCPKLTCWCNGGAFDSRSGRVCSNICLVWSRILNCILLSWGWLCAMTVQWVSVYELWIPKTPWTPVLTVEYFYILVPTCFQTKISFSGIHTVYRFITFASDNTKQPAYITMLNIL